MDLVEIDRVARSLDRWGPRLIGKLMDAAEAARLPADRAERVRALALAIAAKEAASKALGTGWSRGVHWRQVEVELGPPPRLRLRGRASRAAATLGSAGETWTRLELRGALAIGEVRLIR